VAGQQPVKIGVLLPSLQVGGAEKLVVEELSFLKNDPRFSIELHLVFEGGPFHAVAEQNGITMRVWNAPHNSVRMLIKYSMIIRYFRRSRFDILHSHLLDGIGPLIGRLAGAKVIATAHNDRKYGFFQRYGLTRCDLVLGCGTRVMRNVGGFIPADRLRDLNNGIRPPGKKHLNLESLFGRYGIRHDSQLVVSLGRLIQQKGFDVLIKAFRRVSDELPGTVLLIGGEGKDRDSLADLIQEHGLESSVRMTGIIDDTDALLAACDVYVNSSRWEGLPMSLLEAMAHGKSIVATDAGGNVEVVHDGQTGLLVPSENPTAMGNALLTLLRDVPLRNRFGVNARVLFEKEYTIERHCERLKEYYLKVLNA